MKILFMGTPEFAVPSLTSLHDSVHDLVGVVTAPDKPVGRGLKIRPTPVKVQAQELNLPVLQPTGFEDADFLHAVEAIRADLFVVVAFRILPPKVFEMPPKGTVNLHSSLLPKYRGAAPINWAIINGEKETGLTTMFIQQKVDAGDIILQKKVEIGETETAGELHDKLATLGASLLVETVNLIEKGDPPKKLQAGDVTKAPKLTNELAKVDWQRSNEQIRNLIRGLNPYPGAHSFLDGTFIKLFRAERSETSKGSGRPGEVVEVDPKAGLLRVATGSGSLKITELQPEGKRRMPTFDYLKGHKVQVGDRFGPG